jgi:hypothetical protein
MALVQKKRAGISRAIVEIGHGPEDTGTRRRTASKKAFRFPGL